MAEDGQTGRLAAEARPALADLLDPVALEARLTDARARRAEAIARRERESAGAATPSSSVRPWPSQPPRREPTLPAPPAPETSYPAGRVRPVLLAQPAGARRVGRADPGEHPPLARERLPAGHEPRAAKRRLPRAALLFVAGLGLGAAGVVLALRPTVGPPSQTVAEAPPASERVTLPEAPQAITTPPEAPSPGNALQEATAPSATPASGPGPTAPAALPSLALPPPRSEAMPPEMAPAKSVGDMLEAAGNDAGSDPATPAAPASGLPERVTIHYPASAQSIAAEVREALTAAGVGQVEAVPVGFAIGKSNVRYYHGSDQSAAEAAGALLATDLGGAPAIRDFTDYPTPTARGRVEIWIAGEPKGSASSRTREAPVPVANEPLPGPGIDFAPGDQVREVQRILMERLARP